MTTRPAARYGDRRARLPRRWVITVLSVLVVLAGVGVAYAGFRSYGPQDVEGKQVSFDITNESTLSITFLVTRKDPSRPVACIVRARSRDGAETGRREILVEPSTSPTVEVTTTVRTTRPPAAGGVYGCGTDVPAYLRAP